MICRLKEYDSLVELGARIGVKMRERDHGSPTQSQKVSEAHSVSCYAVLFQTQS